LIDDYGGIVSYDTPPAPRGRGVGTAADAVMRLDMQLPYIDTPRFTGAFLEMPSVTILGKQSQERYGGTFHKRTYIKM
jgi:hypothetical protein